MRSFYWIGVIVLAIWFVAQVNATEEAWCHPAFPYTVEHVGSAERDVLFGDATSEKFCGLGGNDIIYAGDGIDFVDGGSGDDTLRGEGDRDYVQGAAGNDSVYGGDGQDYLFGGLDDDLLFGGGDNDEYLYALGDGNDTIDDCHGINLLVVPHSLLDKLSLITVDENGDGIITITDDDYPATIRLKNYGTGCDQISVHARSGDVNGDGTNNSKDWLIWLDMYIGEAPLNAAADINGDGQQSASDLTCLHGIAAMTRTLCDDLDVTDVTDVGLSIGVVYPTSRNITITIPISVTTSQTVNSALFGLQYDPRYLALETTGSGEAAEAVSFNVGLDALGFVGTTSLATADQLELLWAAPENQGVQGDSFAAITFRVVETWSADDPYPLTLDPNIPPTYAVVTTTPTAVGLSNQQIEPFDTVVIALVLVSTLTVVIWRRSNAVA